MSALFFNYLIGATYAHTKNYSLIHLTGNDLFLAPLYDVASMLPYAKTKRGPRVAAMPIGREKRFGKLTRSNIERFAASNSLDSDVCRTLMVDLARTVRDVVGDVVRNNMHVPGVESIGPDLRRCVVANCESMLLNMDRDGRTIDTSLFAQIESGSISRGQGNATPFPGGKPLEVGVRHALDRAPRLARRRYRSAYPALPKVSSSSRVSTSSRYALLPSR